MTAELANGDKLGWLAVDTALGLSDEVGRSSLATDAAFGVLGEGKESCSDGCTESRVARRTESLGVGRTNPPETGPLEGGDMLREVEAGCLASRVSGR